MVDLNGTNLKTVSAKLGVEQPHLILKVEEGEHASIQFPDGRVVVVSCTPDDYSLVDQQGRVLLSVERNLDAGKPGWDNVVVAWPEDDRFKGERPGETGNFIIKVTTDRGADFGVVYCADPDAGNYGISRQLDRAARFHTENEAKDVVRKLDNNPNLDCYDFDVIPRS